MAQGFGLRSIWSFVSRAPHCLVVSEESEAFGQGGHALSFGKKQVWELGCSCQPEVVLLWIAARDVGLIAGSEMDVLSTGASVVVDIGDYICVFVRTVHFFN